MNRRSFLPSLAAFTTAPFVVSRVAPQSSPASPPWDGIWKELAPLETAHWTLYGFRYDRTHDQWTSMWRFEDRFYKGSVEAITRRRFDMYAVSEHARWMCVESSLPSALTHTVARAAVPKRVAEEYEFQVYPQRRTELEPLGRYRVSVDA
jgi:hypothetical protein